MDIKKMLEEILIKKDISQAQLAKELQVSPAQVTYWLKGENYPRRRMVAKIKNLYEETKGEKNFIGIYKTI